MIKIASTIFFILFVTNTTIAQNIIFDDTHFASQLTSQLIEIPPPQLVTINVESPKLYQQDLEKQLLSTLINAGYTITKDTTDYQLHLKLINTQNLPNRSQKLNLLLTIQTPSKTIGKHLTTFAVVSPKIDVQTTANLTYLAGGEIETRHLSLSDNFENRTASINERDLQAGIHVKFPDPRLQSTLMLRTRNSFGRDDLKVYKAFFTARFSNFAMTGGIFPLQLGRDSHYLNTTIESPYWREGIIFDTELNGFFSTLTFQNTNFTLYWGTNRSPSVVLASQIRYFANQYWTFSATALYVNRDDDFNDIGQAGGIELQYQGKNLFLYGVAAVKRFNGSGVNLQRKFVPVLVEYDYRWRKNVGLKGAYFVINQWIEHKDWAVEERFYQEFDVRLSQYLTPGVIYERFDIGDFVTHHMSGVIYYRPFSPAKMAFKAKVIQPKLGNQRFFFGVEGHVEF